MRRNMVVAFTLALAGVAFTAAAAAAQGVPPRPRVTGLAHVALYVHDIEAAAATAKARAARAGYTQPIETKTGINRKRQLNLFDPDGTRTELMEPGTVDGAPTPSSSAPPPRK